MKAPQLRVVISHGEGHVRIKKWYSDDPSDYEIVTCPFRFPQFGWESGVPMLIEDAANSCLRVAELPRGVLQRLKDCEAPSLHTATMKALEMAGVE